MTPYGMAESSWHVANGQITVDIVVPPNTTADVTLPGQTREPFEVGSGTHRWTYRYQVPEERAITISRDSTLGEIMDNPEALRLVMSILTRHLPEVGRNMTAEAKTPWNRSRTLSQLFAQLPNADAIWAELPIVLATSVTAGPNHFSTISVSPTLP